jgi:hypothetical protein
MKHSASKGHTVYISRWLSNPRLFDYLLRCNMKDVERVMPNRNKSHHLLVIKWKDSWHIYPFSSSNWNKMAEM